MYYFLKKIMINNFLYKRVWFIFELPSHIHSSVAVCVWMW